MNNGASPPLTANGMHDNCLNRVRQSLTHLDGARKSVAESILKSPWAVYGLSIGELARLSSVSENAVNRFARTLGYSGYRDFSRALSLDLGRTLGSFHSQPIEAIQQRSPEETTPAHLIARVFDLELAAMRDTITNLDDEQVTRAVTALARASRILFIGTGSAAPLCQMAQYRCSNLGLVAAWTADPMVMISEASSLVAGDVVLAVSYAGQTWATLEALDYARTKRHATTIALTAVQGARISEIAEISLIVFGPDLSIGSMQFAARTAGMVLLEAMISAVSVEKFGTAPPTLDEFSDMQVKINNVGPKWQPARLRKL